MWPPQAPHELTCASVTTILNAGVPKPFLKVWAEKMVAEYAVDYVDRWNGLPRQDAVDLLRRAPFRKMDAKREIGSAVHNAVDAYINGDEFPGHNLTPEQRGYFESALAYLREQRVEVLRNEACVFSRKHGYAGTFDLLQRRGDIGPVEIADFKTSKAVYPEVALQLAAYARADFIGCDDGTEEALPSVGRGVIVQLGPDGSYKAVPVELGDDVFDVFLAAMTLHGWAGRGGLKNRVLGKPLERVA